VNATVKNLRRWIGVRNPDGSYEFPAADLVIAGRVDGHDRKIIVRAPDAVRGRLSWNPGGAGTFTIEGEFRTKKVRVSLDAQFEQTGGLPRATAETREMCNGTSCSVLHDATASRAFGGRRITRFTWQDRQGKELGRTSRLIGLRKLAYPLTLIVHDAQGRYAIAKVESPFAPLIPRLPQPPLGPFLP
jgi:hypothetical protein